MDETIETIEILKKIKLSIRAGSASSLEDIFPERPFEFIFGLGSEGLTPFEYVLAHKPKGSEINTRIDGKNAHDYFGHLGLALPWLTQDIHTLYLHVKVIDIFTADPREVVKEMAQMARCHDHCCDH